MQSCDFFNLQLHITVKIFSNTYSIRLNEGLSRFRYDQRHAHTSLFDTSASIKLCQNEELLPQTHLQKL